MSGSIHPIHEIREILYDLDASDDPDQYAETIRKIREIVHQEYYFWTDMDASALWQLGYSVRRRYEHPETFPFVNPERVFLEEWAHEENDPSAGVNSGMGTLQHLLSENPPSHPLHLRGDDGMDPPQWEIVTKRDWIVAAAFAQWLGTNCGRAFIDRCELRIEAIRKNQRALAAYGDLGDG